MNEEFKIELKKYLEGIGFSEEETNTVIGKLESKEGLTGKEAKGVDGTITKALAGKTDAEKESIYSGWDLDGVTDQVANSPYYKNYKKRQEIAKGIEGGVEALRFLSNKSVARRQIEEAQRLENELTDPSAPPTTPKSQSLVDATEMARRDMSQPIKEIDPILQRNMDLLRQGMNVADTTSGGQAGVSGSMKQAAINQARSANQQMIPAIEGIRRQQKEAYNKLIAQGINEDDMRFKQEMQKYQIAERRYLMEAEAIGGLRAAGEENMYNANQGMWDQFGNMVNPLVNADYGFNKKVDNTPSPTMTAQFQTPQIDPLYDPRAAAYQTGWMKNNTGEAIKNYTTPSYTAISNISKRYQDYNDRLDQNLKNSYSYNLNTFKGI